MLKLKNLKSKSLFYLFEKGILRQYNQIAHAWWILDKFLNKLAREEILEN